MPKSAIFIAFTLILYASTFARSGVIGIMPPGNKIRTDHPRILVRTGDDPIAISTGQLKALKHDKSFEEGLKILKNQSSAACQAMAWLLTDDEEAAEKAITRLKNYSVIPDDAFDVWFGLRELSLAYDWLYHHPKFTDEIKRHVRNRAFILAEEWGIKEGDDHVFHNYTWMNNCGLAMWTMACYGEDQRAEKLMETARFRLNRRMFPAMEHLNGMPADAMGYWYLYCASPCIWTLMAIQSAYGIDAMSLIRDKQNNWLAKQLESSIHGTLPNMRFIPWGDIQSGPDGGVTHEWAGPAEAAAWALKNAHGVYFKEWLSGKRGMDRFYGDTAILYFLYTRHLDLNPTEPPLSMLAGGSHSGQVIMRSSWEDDATVVGFRCTDYYQGHFHHDAGSFVIYRNGLLAVDAGRYTRYTESLRAPIIATNAHNSLLLGGKGQRTVRGQWYKDLSEFNKAREERRDDRRLEFGDIVFYKDAGEWTAVAGQFAQAYKPGVIKSCVRQLLYIRPNTILVVDNLVPSDGKNLPEVRWVVNLPSDRLEAGKGFAETANAKSWLRCRSLVSGNAPILETSPQTQLTADRRQLSEIARINFVYSGRVEALTLVHLIHLGDGQPGTAQEVKLVDTGDTVEINTQGRTFIFLKNAPFTIEARQ
jgi:hypothetical protein